MMNNKITIQLLDIRKKPISMQINFKIAICKKEVKDLIDGRFQDACYLRIGTGMNISVFTVEEFLKLK